MANKLTKSEQERFDEYDERWATLDGAEREDYKQLLAKRNGTDLTGWDALGNGSPRIV